MILQENIKKAKENFIKFAPLGPKHLI